LPFFTQTLHLLYDTGKIKPCCGEMNSSPRRLTFAAGTTTCGFLYKHERYQPKPRQLNTSITL